jgi:hypothetical protein
MNGTWNYIWDTAVGRVAIYRAIMRRLYKNDAERQQCVDDYQYGVDMVSEVMRENALGEIPPGRKVVFLLQGDYDQGEMPVGMQLRPAGTSRSAGGASAELASEQKRQYKDLGDKRKKENAAVPDLSKVDTDRTRLTYKAGSSLIITLPPPEDSDWQGQRVLDYACSYIIWEPQPSSKKPQPKKRN